MVTHFVGSTVWKSAFSSTSCTSLSSSIRATAVLRVGHSLCGAGRSPIHFRTLLKLELNIGVQISVHGQTGNISQTRLQMGESALEQ